MPAAESNATPSDTPSAGAAQAEDGFQSAVALVQQGQFERAEAHCLAMLADAPDRFDTLQLLGVIMAMTGRHEQAIEYFDRALRAEPDNVEARRNRQLAVDRLNRIRIASALALQQQGQLSQAEAIHRSVLQLDPDNFDALQLLGTIALERKNPPLAVDFLDRALRLRPDDADAHYNRGNAWHDSNRLDEALASYDRALACNPDHADAHYNRGNTLKALQRLEEAVASYGRAVRVKPAFAAAHNNLGMALQELQRFDAAVASHDRALDVDPGYALAYYNRGNALHELNRFEEALASYDRALHLDPDHAAAHYNRGNTLKALKRPDEALASYGRALAIQPDYAEANWNEGLCRLLIGDFATGWQRYEWRWQCKDRTDERRNYVQPAWHGTEDIGGKVLFLYAEQGFGDTIQFCRYAQYAAARGATVVMEVPAALQPLLKALEGISAVVGKGDPIPPFDFHCALMSLPLAFKTGLADISGAPYLQAPAQALPAWRSRIGDAAKRRLGVAWSGSTTHKNDQNRSIPLTDFQRLFIDGVDCFCLQAEIRPDDKAVLSRLPAVKSFETELVDFAQTAALVSLMDLVVTVDTSVAHLAGALGKEVWLLLPYVPDWRWLLDRSDSPWYDSVTLFRQPAIGDWGSVLDEVKRLLLQRFAA